MHRSLNIRNSYDILKMKSLLKILPKSLIRLVNRQSEFKQWKKRNYLENAPQSVKEGVLKKYSLKNCDWIETGTFLGTTTHFLSERFPHDYSIEPSVELYKAAHNRFQGKNVTLYNDTSENVLRELLPTLEGNLNFWLDGHYSEGITFRGNKDCPIIGELNIIDTN